MKRPRYTPPPRRTGLPLIDMMLILAIGVCLGLMLSAALDLIAFNLWGLRVLP